MSFPDAFLNEHSAIRMPEHTIIRYNCFKRSYNVLGLLPASFMKIDEILFLNAIEIRSVWRGILLHRGNMPRQGCSVGRC